uniref:DIS3-like exonuclease 2 (Trinotate prediction) n=1 Tax=Henneguya salminicola TaxID=69463 RepID=A0A6G3MEC5_HENSL
MKSETHTDLENISSELRLDLTSECVFTIDPATACDLDDAISFKPLPDNKFQIGVHIADVSYFVKPGSELDERAKLLCTSVYLTHRAYHMLPSHISGDICSLNPAKNRYTVSVMFTIDSSFQIVDTWIGRSIIRSCAKLCYEDAQKLIDSSTCPDNSSIIVHNGFNLKDIHSQLHEIRKFTLFIRNKRLTEGGSLKLDTPEIFFNLDFTKKYPISLQIHELTESNNLIEELMLLSNQTIAQTIFSKFPASSVLRIHRSPHNTIGPFLEMLNTFGYKIDASSSSSLSKSLEELSNMNGTKIVSGIIYFLSKPMHPASYVFTGSEIPVDSDVSYGLFHHYGLNVDLYTHFTSPIRRYPDVLVHRLLLSTLTDDSNNDFDLEKVESVIERCNQQQRAAAYSSLDSQRYNLWLFIRNHGTIECEAMLIPDTDSNKKNPRVEILLFPYCLPLAFKGSDKEIKKLSYFKLFSALVSINENTEPHKCIIDSGFNFKVKTSNDIHS